MNYYNEWDKYAAQWLRNLIEAKLIPAGDVDERSIVDVQAKELKGYTQCHFFAGIGGWSLALQLARWPADRPVWTGSCPCQPFSVAGKAGGVGDERHLWPAFRRLIADGRPSAVFGEQVASADGKLWLAGVRLDLEGMGYAVGSSDLCSAGVGAPNIRQRLYWVADSENSDRRTGTRWKDGAEAGNDRRMGSPIRPRLEGHAGHGDHGDEPGRIGAEAAGPAPAAGAACGLGNPEGARHASGGFAEQEADKFRACGSGETCRVEHSTSDGRESGPQLHGEHDGKKSGGGCDALRLAHAMPAGRAARGAESGDGSPAGSGLAGGMADTDGRQSGDGGVQRSGKYGLLQEDRRLGFWSRFEVIPCRDGKARLIEPGTFPLASGVPARMGKIRAYGNAINPQIAAEFVKAYMECTV